MTVADSIRLSSTSLIDRLPVIPVGAEFSMYAAGCTSIVASCGASLTGMTSISRDNGLLSTSPSLTDISTVRVAVEGFSLVVS